MFNPLKTVGFSGAGFGKGRKDTHFSQGGYNFRVKNLHKIKIP